MKQCAKCLSENISTILDKDQVFYYCNDCGAKNERIFDISGNLKAVGYKDSVKHVSVIALIRRKDEIMLVNRRHFPFGLAFPAAGHVLQNETPSQTLERELSEETGFSLIKKRLIFHDTIEDKCRFGANYHELYLYECIVGGELILNSESNGTVWAEIKDLPNLNIIPQAKIVLSKIGLLDKKFLEKNTGISSQNTGNPVIETAGQAIAESLSSPIVLTDNNGNLTYANKSAGILIRNIDYGKELVLETLKLAKRVVKSGRKELRKITIGEKSFMLSGSDLPTKKGEIVPIVSIKNISGPQKPNLRDVIAYQTSISLNNIANDEQAIEYAIKRLSVLSPSILEANLMLVEKDKLKVLVAYSKQKRINPDNIKMSVGEGIAGHVVKTGHMIAVPNTNLEPRFIKRNKIPYSLLSIPVIYKNKVIGVLNLKKECGSYFIEDEANVSMIFANRVGLALENEKLYKSLENQKNTLERVLGATTDGLILVDKNYNLTFYNESAKKLLPLKNNDIENKTIKNYLAGLSEVNSAKISSCIRKSIKKKKPITSEFTSQKGREKMVKAHFSPIIEPNKKCTSVVIGIHDTTKLIKKQKTVKQQVKQLTELFKISSMPVSSPDFFKCVLTKTAKILDSQTADLFFLKSEEDSTGFTKNPLSEIPLLIKQIEEKKGFSNGFICNHVQDHFKDIVNVKKTIATPVIVGGQTIGILYAINKDADYHSRDIKWLSIIADRLSSRIETTKLIKQIAKERQQIQNIVDNTGDGIIAVKSDGKIVTCNKAMEQVTGFENSNEFFDANPEMFQVINELNLASSKETLHKHFQIKNYDGQFIWLGITFSSIQSQDGDYVIAVFRDISKEKTLDDRNKEFIYTTTHELRTPITAIKGYLSMILNGDAGDINPRQKVYFDRVYKSTERLVSLVENLLKTAKLEEDKVTTNNNLFDVNKLIREITADFKLKAEAKKIDLIYNPNKKITIFGDFELTKQALSNLVDNSIKYTADGSVTINAKKIDNKYAEISVRDTGVGIPKKDQEMVFTKFYRVPNSESIKAGGTGLGLFIVKNLIEKQGGRINIISKLGEGTEISVIMPTNK